MMEGCVGEAHVAVQVALAAVDDDAGPGAWTPVVRQKRRTETELLQEFWSDVGFPSPSSRFWERGSSAGSGTKDELDFDVSSCRMRDRTRSTSPVTTSPGAEELRC